MADKVLFAFDFDHTLVDDNTDLWVLRCNPELGLEDKLPDIRKNFSCWPSLRAHMFQLLHDNKCNQQDIIDWMKKLRLIPVMESFLRNSINYPSVDVMVISDSNTVFIETILKECGCLNEVKEMHTNPAWFNDDGLLVIQPYHAHTCAACAKTPNMCKGTILNDVISKGSYSRVIYIGDGRNDVCPSLRLAKSDAVLARKGYRLAEELQALSKGQLKAKLHVLDFTSHETEDILRSLLPHIPSKQ